MTSTREAFSRVLVDRALADSGWDLTDPGQVALEITSEAGRIDYCLRQPRTRPLRA